MGSVASPVWDTFEINLQMKMITAVNKPMSLPSVLFKVEHWFSPGRVHHLGSIESLTAVQKGFLSTVVRHTERTVP